jgi:hypothetical protein
MSVLSSLMQLTTREKNKNESERNAKKGVACAGIIISIIGSRQRSEMQKAKVEEENHNKPLL